MTPPLIWWALKNPKAFLKQIICRHVYPDQSFYWMNPDGCYKLCPFCKKAVPVAQQILPRQD